VTEERTTRRDLMKPVQLLGLALAAALFAGFVTLIAMGFFQQRYASESMHALVIALIVTGIVFIVTVVVISLLLLAINPADFSQHPIDRPVLLDPKAPERRDDAR
jgi:amino acid transporter